MRHPRVTYAGGVQQPGGSTGSSRGGLDIDIGPRLPATSGLTKKIGPAGARQRTCAVAFADLADAIRAWARGWLPAELLVGHLAWPLREGFLQVAMEVLRSRQVGTAAINFGQLAHADGSSRVVAPVVETPWTGSATRDAVRHCGAESSAHAGLHRRDESL
jgi:hypothetical protein